MSTKVYTGFKFVSRSMGEIVTALAGLKKDFELLQRKRYLSAYACLMVHYLDRSQHDVRAGKTEGMAMATPGRQARADIQKRQSRIRATMERDPAVDLEFELRCWHSLQLDEVIGYVYGEFSSDVLKLLKRKGLATDYAYWNNSDKASRVSKKEWTQREAAWHEALNGHSGARFDFRYDGMMQSLPFRWSDVEPFLPTLDFRARELVEPDLAQGWYDALADKAADRSDIHERLSEFRKLLRDDPETKEKLSAAIEICKPLLLTGDALSEASLTMQLLVPSVDFG